MPCKSALLYFPPELVRIGSEPWEVPEHLEKGVEASGVGVSSDLCRPLKGLAFIHANTLPAPPQLPESSQSTWRVTCNFSEPISLWASQWYSPLIFLVTEDRVSVSIFCSLCSVSSSLSGIPSLSQDIVEYSGLLLRIWHVMVTEFPSFTIASSGLISNFGESGGAKVSGRGDREFSEAVKR